PRIRTTWSNQPVQQSGRYTDESTSRTIQAFARYAASIAFRSASAHWTANSREGKPPRRQYNWPRSRNWTVMPYRLSTSSPDLGAPFHVRTKSKSHFPDFAARLTAWGDVPVAVEI